MRAVSEESRRGRFAGLATRNVFGKFVGLGKRLVGALAQDDGARRTAQDEDVQPERPIPDVVGIEVGLHFQIAFTAG